MSKTAASHLHNCMRTLLSVSLLSLVFSLDEGYTQRVQYKYESHHIFQVSSLLPSASCTTSSTGAIRKSSLEVVHKHGPCSPYAGAKPNRLNHTKILVGDQSRVDLIRSKISTSSSSDTNKGDGLGSSKAAVLAKLGIPFDSVEYVVIVGLGSTRSKLTLTVDTGSDLTWTQCEPCSSCYPQSEPIFDPSHSSSYAISHVPRPCAVLLDQVYLFQIHSSLFFLNMDCALKYYDSYSRRAGIPTSCSGSTCSYQITYGDLSYTSGKLTTYPLTSTDVIRNFQFGCGGFNFGIFGEVAGLLGLACDGLSIVGQTASKYGRYFSYCLPSSSSSRGYLTFGKTSETPKSLTSTPIATIQESSLFYGINIVEIAVGGTTLQIPSIVFSKAVIDSGTVITRLPPTVYSAMRTAFRKEMASYKMAKSFDIFDTCYDLRNTKSVIVPRIRFTFSGGAFMDLDRSGILYTISDSQVCLAFVPNNDDNDIVIYGNVQQKMFEVIYDVARGQLGFAPNGCQ